MIGWDSRLPVKQRMRLYSSSLIKNSLKSQRSDDDLFTIEFHEIEAAKSRGILVLTTAFDSDIVAFDIVGQSRHAGGGDWQAKQLTKQANQRDGKRRGTSKPGARRRVGMDEEIETRRCETCRVRSASALL